MEVGALFACERGPATLALSLQARPVQKFVRIYGTGMSLYIGLATSVLLCLRALAGGIFSHGLTNVDQSAQPLTRTLANAVKILTGQFSRGHETLIDRFYTALGCGETPPADGEEGLATVVVRKALGQDVRRSA